MLLAQALSKSHKVRRAVWSPGIAWTFNLKTNEIAVSGTEIVRTLISVENAVADDWEPWDPSQSNKINPPGMLMTSAFMHVAL